MVSADSGTYLFYARSLSATEALHVCTGRFVATVGSELRQQFPIFEALRRVAGRLTYSKYRTVPNLLYELRNNNGDLVYSKLIDIPA
jgi:hypothetical protein